MASTDAGSVGSGFALGRRLSCSVMASTDAGSVGTWGATKLTFHRNCLQYNEAAGAKLCTESRFYYCFS